MPALSVLTIGQIAKQLKQPISRIIYAQRSRGIQPAAHAGHQHLYTPAQIDEIRAAVESLRPYPKTKN